jgi:hypothetical protein
MGIDSVSSGQDIDGTADSADQTERAPGRQASDGGAGDRLPAEPLNREEYSAHVRARGSPIGQHDTPVRETAESGQSGARADTPEASASDRVNGRSPDPETDTGDIDSGTSSPEYLGRAREAPQPSGTETTRAAHETGQAGRLEGGPAERITRSPARTAESGGNTRPGADSSRSGDDEALWTEPHEQAQIHADPALAADARTVAQDRAAGTDRGTGTEPGETGERVTASGQPGTSPDKAAAEPHWEDAWNLPDGRQVRVHIDGDRDWMHSDAGDPKGRPPTGERLLSMEDDDASRSEKLRNKFFEKENCESFLDAEKEGAKVVQEVLSPSQHGSAHTLTPTVEIMPTQPPQAGAGDALTGITVLALLSAEAVRSAVRHWRGVERK